MTRVIARMVQTRDISVLLSMTAKCVLQQRSPEPGAGWQRSSLEGRRFRILCRMLHLQRRDVPWSAAGGANGVEPCPLHSPETGRSSKKLVGGSGFLGTSY